MAVPRDATADFQEALNDPTRWVIKPGVPIFKPHQRKDPTTGAMIQVDLPKLYRIAANIQHLERQGVPVRMTLGHTEPGKPETEQPPVGGYYRNARVQPFGPTGEPAVVVDEWLDPQYAGVRKNFPYRSAEYYDDAESITGVALLTRDPFLDLGVVAYTKEPDRVPTRYAAVPGGKRPIFYHYVTGEAPMAFPAYIPQPQGAAPAPQAAPAPVYGPVPAGVGFAPAPAPAYYAAQPQMMQQALAAPMTIPEAQVITTAQVPTSEPVLYRSWPGPAHQRANIGKSHPSGAGAAVYATQTPPSMGGEMGGMGMGGGMGAAPNPLEQVAELLSQAVSLITQLTGAGGGAPQSPFPEQGAAGPNMNARYGRRPMPRPRFYGAPGAPTPYGGPSDAQRTITGLPVGYQMKVDQLQYQLGEANRALKVLYYERDQADTETCVAQIRHLAAQGYQVGEYEVRELKSKPKDQREAYLQHVMTHYQKVGVEMAPPVLGDPTPGEAPVHMSSRPASREEMEAAVSMSASDPRPDAFTKALNYIRSGQAASGMAGSPAMDLMGGPMPGAWSPGSAAPQTGTPFIDPYAGY